MRGGKRLHYATERTPSAPRREKRPQSPACGRRQGKSRTSPIRSTSPGITRQAWPMETDALKKTFCRKAARKPTVPQKRLPSSQAISHPPSIAASFKQKHVLSCFRKITQLLGKAGDAEHDEYRIPPIRSEGCIPQGLRCLLLQMEKNVRAYGILQNLHSPNTALPPSASNPTASIRHPPRPTMLQRGSAQKAVPRSMPPPKDCPGTHPRIRKPPVRQRSCA